MLQTSVISISAGEKAPFFTSERLLRSEIHTRLLKKQHVESRVLAPIGNHTEKSRSELKGGKQLAPFHREAPFTNRKLLIAGRQKQLRRDDA